ncbi:unnamed protein product, partial [Nesidiocoris tenuis]
MTPSGSTFTSLKEENVLEEHTEARPPGADPPPSRLLWPGRAGADHVNTEPPATRLSRERRRPIGCFGAEPPLAPHAHGGLRALTAAHAPHQPPPPSSRRAFRGRVDPSFLSCASTRPH